MQVKMERCRRGQTTKTITSLQQTMPRPTAQKGAANFRRKQNPAQVPPKTKHTPSPQESGVHANLAFTSSATHDSSRRPQTMGLLFAFLKAISSQKAPACRLCRRRRRQRPFVKAKQSMMPASSKPNSSSRQHNSPPLGRTGTAAGRERARALAAVADQQKELLSWTGLFFPGLGVWMAEGDAG